MLPTIELVIDEESDKIGVFAISLVEEPAIESNFIALSKHEVKMKTIDKKKGLVIGLALRPDQKIYRKRGEMEFNIEFSKDTVRKASQLYLREMRNHNTTADHEHLVSGVYLAESWIVEDPKRDKTAVYGIDAKEGDWAIVMKVENQEVQDRIDAGEYLGFSIEGIFDERPVDEYQVKWDKIKKILES